MSLSRQIRRGAALQLGARLFSSCVSFVITAVVLARVLPEAEYGLFNFYLTLFLLAMTLVDFGANRAAIRMIAAGAASRAAVIRAAVAFKARVGLLAFLVITALIVLCEHGTATRVALVIAALHCLSHGFGGASVGCEVDLDYRVPARSVVFGYATFLLLGLLLAQQRVAQAPPYLMAWGLGVLVQNCLLFATARRRGEIAGGVDAAVLRALLREALPLGLSAVAVAIYFYADTVMLRPLRGEEDVAVYSVAYRLMTFGLMVPVLFSQVLFPVFTRCHERSAELLARAVRRSTFYLALAGAIGGAILLGEAERLLVLVFGGDYGRAAPSLRILAVAMMVVYLTYPHTTALIAAGRAAVFTRITVISALLNVLLNLLVIVPLGPAGAALTTLVTELFVLLCGVIALWRIRRVSGGSVALLGPLALFLLLSLLLWLAARAGVSLWLSLLAALVVAALGVWLLRALPFRLGVEEEELA